MTAVILAFGMAGSPAEARSSKGANYTQVMNSDWQRVFELVKNQSDPVAKKLLTWIYVTETTMPVDVKTTLDFVKTNTSWPRLHEFREAIEEDIDSAGLTTHGVAEWFRLYPPETVSGITAFADALLSLGAYEEATRSLSNFWKEAVLEKRELQRINSQYGKYLPLTAHADRMDNLLWSNRYNEAEDLLSYIDISLKPLAQARISLGRQSSKAPSAVNNVPAKYQSDQGLLFDRMRWKRRNDKSYLGLEILNAVKGKFLRPEHWWKEQNILARRAIEQKKYRDAFNIIKAHDLEPGSGADFVQAEWLIGWLSLRHLGKPNDAYLHFDNLYQHVKSVISKSRAAYWAAEAAAKAGQAQLAKNWQISCASYLSTFYGQICYQKIYGAPDPSKFLVVTPTAEETAYFNRREIVRAIKILQDVGLDRLTDGFFAKLIDGAVTKTDYVLIARLANKIGRIQYVVQANKSAQQDLGEFLWPDGYPVLRGAGGDGVEKALVHAIIYRESMFNKEAVSPAGALGLMQVMPATAQMVAKKSKKQFSKSKLTQDPSYNIAIGSDYLEYLIDTYDGYYPLSIAAYNAGPGNVKKWVDKFGNPAAQHTSVIEWVEHIPIYETRNYVQRVLETYYMYRLRFNETPKTIKDMSK